MPSMIENLNLRLCSDQMEEWTTAEAALFEEAMEKQGKHYCFFLSLSLYSPFFLFVKILPTSMIENLN